MKQNCWDFNNCGFQANGHRSKEIGVCPACTEHRLNGVHGGTNGGRACWVVSGTYCDGEVQGGYSDKIVDCRACGFFNIVSEQEGEHALKTATMLDMLA